MKRLLMMCALAGLAVACSDDADDKPNVTTDGGLDSGTDAGRDSGGGDAGMVAAKVTNLGAKCTAAATCTGPAAICETTTINKWTVPGGSCSAVCSADAECGSGGVCPVGVAIKAYGAMASEPLMVTEGHCSKSCASLGATTCGAGLTCISLDTLRVQSGMAAVGIAPLNQFFCAPVPATDGGVGDGGTALKLDGGLDGGK